MFKDSNSTVFILGAGASWHYGYPTGEELVKKVIQKASIAAHFCQHSRAISTQRPNYLSEGQGVNPQWPVLWDKARDDCEKLKAGLEQVKPLVIDYYLGWNPDLQSIGRLLIAWVILECEHFSQKTNINRGPTEQGRDDWCRFIIHQIAINCKDSEDLRLNKVSFVTFNYDVSLEHALCDGLKHIQMFRENDVAAFLGGSRITHVYGKIRDVTAVAAGIVWDAQNENPTDLRDAQLINYQVRMKELLDAAYAASKGLRVIDPDDKGTNDTEIMIARTVIANVSRIFILGYGFYENNSDRLNLRETLRHDVRLANKRIAFTNYQDINQINKRASKLFYGARQFFPPGGPAIQDRYEKSIRNTYDALAMDFDLAD
jgi:hypothetical protein